MLDDGARAAGNDVPDLVLSGRSLGPRPLGSLGKVPATAGELSAERTDGVTPLVSLSLHQHPDEFDGAVQVGLNVWRPGCTDAEVDLRPREARALSAKLSDALTLLDDMLTNGSRVADQGDTAVDSEYEVRPAGASAVTATTTPVATCPTWCDLPAWHPCLDVDSVDCYRTHRVSFGEDVRVYSANTSLIPADSPDRAATSRNNPTPA